MYFSSMGSHRKKQVFAKRIFWDRYYGDGKVAEALLNAKYLSERMLNLAAAVIDHR